MWYSGGICTRMTCLAYSISGRRTGNLRRSDSSNYHHIRFCKGQKAVVSTVVWYGGAWTDTGTGDWQMGKLLQQGGIWRLLWRTFCHAASVSAVRTSDLTEKLMSHTTVIDGVEYISVHPTFLYESFWNLCLFILLMLYFKHRKFDGEVFLLYLLGYGIGRFWIESLRTDQLLIPHINYPVSMALAATLVAVSAIWIGIVRYKQMKMGKMVDTPPQSTTKE